MGTVRDDRETRYATYLSGTVEESWARCLPLWSARGRVNDRPRSIHFPKYLPSFETKLGRSFVEKYAEQYPFLLNRLQSNSELEVLCAFDLLDFLAWQTMTALPEGLRQCTLPLPGVVRNEVEGDSHYRDRGLGTIGKLLSFEHNGAEPPAA